MDNLVTSLKKEKKTVTVKKKLLKLTTNEKEIYDKAQSKAKPRKSYLTLGPDKLSGIL